MIPKIKSYLTNIDDQWVLNLEINVPKEFSTSCSCYLSREGLDYLSEYLIELLTKVYNLGDNHGWHEGYNDAKEDYNIDG